MVVTNRVATSRVAIRVAILIHNPRTAVTIRVATRVATRVAINVAILIRNPETVVSTRVATRVSTRVAILIRNP